MNISPLTIYLWQLADKLDTPMSVLSSISGVSALIMFIILMVQSHCVGYYKAKNTAHGNYADDLGGAEAVVALLRPWMRRTLGIFFVSFSLVTFVPSSNTIAMMIIVPKIADSKVIQHDLPDVYNAAISALKAAITPVLPEVKK